MKTALSRILPLRKRLYCQHLILIERQLSPTKRTEKIGARRVHSAAINQAEPGQVRSLLMASG